jgi:DNA repair exonuclease SbcCD ATPase subunit
MELSLDSNYLIKDNYETEYNLLKKKLADLENELVVNKKVVKKINDIIKVIDTHVHKINNHQVILNEQKEYITKIFKFIQEICVAQQNYDTKISELKDIIDINDRLLKQKDEEISKIIKKQEEQDKQILELREYIKKDIKQNIDTEEELNKNKRKLSVITNDYIEQLIQSKKKAHPWSKDMSKYICISKVNNKWRWETTIFDENYKNFNTKEEAEKYYESIIMKYNIDPIYITRYGYN